MINYDFQNRFLERVEELVGCCLKLSDNSGVSVVPVEDTAKIVVFMNDGSNHGMLNLKYSTKAQKVCVTGMTYAGKQSGMLELMGTAECCEQILLQAARTTKPIIL